MNVKELILELQKVEDKSLKVRYIDVSGVEDKSLEVRCIDVSGEVRLLASE